VSRKRIFSYVKSWKSKKQGKGAGYFIQVGTTENRKEKMRKPKMECFGLSEILVRFLPGARSRTGISPNRPATLLSPARESVLVTFFILPRASSWKAAVAARATACASGTCSYHGQLLCSAAGRG